MSRKEQAILTKNKLFEIAIKLIKENGYDNVTISEICKEAKVAKGTFYVHYKSKEDIIKESYYFDMSEFVLSKYNKFILNNEVLPIKDKIQKFLLLELMFTKHVGHTMTCLAYITNLTECISKDSKHFEIRTFTEKLKFLISDGINKNVFKTNQTADEIFLYLESLIRGIMASWCFAGGNFDIVKNGQKYINEVLKNL